MTINSAANATTRFTETGDSRWISTGSSPTLALARRTNNDAAKAIAMSGAAAVTMALGENNARIIKFRANIATIVKSSAAMAASDDVLLAPNGFASSTAAALLLTTPPRNPLR